MIRTFLAIELPRKIIEGLGEEQARWISRAPALKWVRPERIHLTLKFLGEIPGKRVDQVVETVRGCCSRNPAFALALKGSGVFPNPRYPRVLWVGVTGDLDILKRLHADMESSLEEIGFPRETREFRPHLTLARIKGRVPEGFVRDFLRAGISLGPIEVTEITVFQSRLSPSGPDYIPLAKCPLVVDQGR